MISLIKKFFKRKKIEPEKILENYIEVNIKYQLVDALKYKNKEMVANLYECLVTKDENIFKKVLELITELTNKLKIEDYKYLDFYFRNKSSIEYNIEWKDMNSSVFIKDFMNEKEKIVIYGLSTFHPNGYFREKNLLELIKYNTGEELKFIFLRTNDWVDKINKIAEREFINRLTISNLEEVIKILPLIYRAKSWGNCNIALIEDKIKELMVNCKDTTIILNQLKSDNYLIRNLCYRTLIEIDYDSKKLLEYAIKETSPELRYFIYKSLIKIGKDVQDYLENDRYYKIRLEWISLIGKSELSIYREKLIKKVFDKSEIIRAEARKLLNKIECIDFIEFYKGNLGINTYKSLLGLSDLASEKDKDIFGKYLEHKRTDIKVCAIKSLAKISFIEHENLFYDCIESENRVVSMVGLKILNNHIYQLNDTRLYKIYLHSNIEHAKENSVKLLIKSNKWNSLKHLLKFLDSNNIKIRELAEFGLENWVKNFNRSYLKFNGDFEEYNKLINDSSKIDEKMKKWLLFSLK